MRIMEHAKGIGLNGKGERTMIGNMRNTVPLALASRNADDSASLTLTLPETELSEPKQTIESSRGITHTMNWRAFTTPGENAPSITLSNSVATYAVA